jgi:MarR family transcriptional regulator, organic hydroperoxide resistance regulator
MSVIEIDATRIDGPPLLAQVFRLRFHRIYTLLIALGLYPGQHHLLMQLGRLDGISQVDLAKMLMIKPSTLTVMVGRMARIGLVTKKQDELDKRIVRIYLTEKGKKLLTEAHIRMEQIEKETFEGFSEEEMAQFGRFAQRMKQNLIQATKGEMPCHWF